MRDILVGRKHIDNAFKIPTITVTVTNRYNFVPGYVILSRQVLNIHARTGTLVSKTHLTLILNHIFFNLSKKDTFYTLLKLSQLPSMRFGSYFHSFCIPSGLEPYFQIILTIFMY